MEKDEPLSSEWIAALMERLADQESRLKALERDRDEKLLWQAMLEKKPLWMFKWKQRQYPEELRPLFEAFREKYGEDPFWLESLPHETGEGAGHE